MAGLVMLGGAVETMATASGGSMGWEYISRVSVPSGRPWEHNKAKRYSILSWDNSRKERKQNQLGVDIKRL